MYIKATELRIGNYVWPFIVFRLNDDPDTKLVGYVSSITEEGILFSNWKATQLRALQPIEINDRWLDKFYFVNPDKSSDSYQLKIDIYGNQSLMSITSPTGYPNEWGVNLENFLPTIQIKYVHHLQNLYFALTGEELKIKE